MHSSAASAAAGASAAASVSGARVGVRGASRRVRGVLLDVAGVLHVDYTPIPGAPAALARLRALGPPVLLLTNTDCIPKAALLARLARAGFPEEALDPAGMLTAPEAACALVQARGLNPLLLLHPDVLPDFAGVLQRVQEGRTPDAVVLGDQREHLSHAGLTRAFRLLMANPSAPLVTTGGSRRYRDTDGFCLDVGAVAKTLEFAAEREAIVAGKPARAFFEAALARIGCAAEDAIMVGDDVLSDVRGAQEVGMRGVLVRTGKCTPADECRTDVTPFAVVDDFSAAVDLVEELLRRGSDAAQPAVEPPERRLL